MTLAASFNDKGQRSRRRACAPASLSAHGQAGSPRGVEATKAMIATKVAAPSGRLLSIAARVGVLLMCAIGRRRMMAVFAAALSAFASVPGAAREIDVSNVAGLRNAVALLAGSKARAGDNVDRVDITLRAGVYRLDEPLTMTLDQSWRGTPITISGPAGGSAVISGAHVVTGFTPVRDPVARARLPAAARDKILVADLAQNGVKNLGTFERHGFGIPVKPAPLELFYRGQPMAVARWPSSGFATIGALGDGERGRSFTIGGADPARWKNEPDLRAVGYWARDWADMTLPVESIDPSSGSITVAAPAPQFGIKVGQRVYIENALSELTQPGEYYIDRRSSRVYFWPPAPLKESDVEVSVAESLLDTSNVSNLALRDLTFDIARGDALKLQGGGNLSVDRVTLRNAGNRAVMSTASNVRFRALTVENTGEGGMVIFAGDRNRLVPGNVVVANSTFRDFARRSRTYRPAISVSGVGDRIENNVIHDGPHAAIIFSGNDHVIAGNEIYRVATESGDTGAIYTGRDWTARGTVIEGNFLHDIGNTATVGNAASARGTMGIYLDDQASGITIRGNVFSRTNYAVFIGGGRDNVVDDNLFANCSPAIYIDSRGLSWQRELTNDPNGVLRNQLAARRVEAPPYSTRYPTLANLLSDEPGAPKGNVLARNVVIGGKPLSIDGGAQRYVKIDALFDESDVVFTKPMPDAARASLTDLQLSRGSPALERGFKAPTPTLEIR